MKPVMLAVVVLLVAVPAHALYKCQIDGKVEYRDLPCPTGKQADIKVDPMRPRPEDARRYKAQVLNLQIQQLNADIQKSLDARQAEIRDARCRKLGRDLDWTRSRAQRWSSDPWWANRAQDRQEEFDAQCN